MSAFFSFCYQHLQSADQDVSQHHYKRKIKHQSLFFAWKVGGLKDFGGEGFSNFIVTQQKSSDTTISPPPAPPTRVINDDQSLKTKVRSTSVEGFSSPLLAMYCHYQSIVNPFHPQPSSYLFASFSSFLCLSVLQNQYFVVFIILKKTFCALQDDTVQIPVTASGNSQNSSHYSSPLARGGGRGMKITVKLT